MPFYDYFCKANGQTVEVYHSISQRLKNWGEVCQRAQIDPGKTLQTASVVRLIGGHPVVWRVKGLDKEKPSTKMEF